MKALSIRQPYASLIIKGAPIFKSVDNGDRSSHIEFAGVVYKDVENRNRPTGFRGRICVHAPLKADDFIETMRRLGNLGLAPYACMILASLHYSPRGCIIGEVDIVDCKYRCGDTNANLFSIWHDVGMYGYLLANPVAYQTPIRYRGQLGFFEVDKGLHNKRYAGTMKKDCEQNLAKGNFGFNELSGCIVCQNPCKTMIRLLMKPTKRRIGMVSGK